MEQRERGLPYKLHARGLGKLLAHTSELVFKNIALVEKKVWLDSSNSRGRIALFSQRREASDDL